MLVLPLLWAMTRLACFIPVNIKLAFHRHGICHWCKYRILIELKFTVIQCCSVRRVFFVNSLLVEIFSHFNKFIGYTRGKHRFITLHLRKYGQPRGILFSFFRPHYILCSVIQLYLVVCSFWAQFCSSVQCCAGPVNLLSLPSQGKHYSGHLSLLL